MDPIHIDFTIPDLSLYVGFGLLVFAITLFLAISKHREKFKSFAHPFAWLAENYLWVILPLGAFAIGFAIYEWIWQILPKVGEIISRLKPAEQSPTDIRSLAYAIGALLAAVALSATIPFQLIKVWVNERLAKTTEQGHMTDRITKAVEQLGAEKTVKLHREDSAGKKQFEKVDGKLDYKKPIITETTEPNLEVRLGAIYALERIALDSLRDHIPVMEILCAYVRLNSPRENGVEFKVFSRQYSLPLSGMSEYQRHPMRLHEETKAKEHRDKQEIEVNALPLPRIDIQAALTAIGRRSDLSSNSSQFSKYSPNLSGCNLQKAELIGNFSQADFSNSLWDGATLSGEFENCLVDRKKAVALKLKHKEMYALQSTSRSSPKY